MFCPQCGKQLPDSANFCDSCGTRIDAFPASVHPASAVIPPSQVQEPVSGDTAQKKKPKRRSPLLGILLLVVAVLWAAVWIYCFRRQGMPPLFLSRGIILYNTLPLLILPFIGMLLIGLYGVIQYPGRRYPVLAAIGAFILLINPFYEVAQRFILTYMPYRFLRWQLWAFAVAALLILIIVDCLLYRRTKVLAIIGSAGMIFFPLLAWGKIRGFFVFSLLLNLMNYPMQLYQVIPKLIEALFWILVLVMMILSASDAKKKKN